MNIVNKAEDSLFPYYLHPTVYGHWAASSVCIKFNITKHMLHLMSIAKIIMCFQFNLLFPFVTIYCTPSRYWTKFYVHNYSCIEDKITHQNMFYWLVFFKCYSLAWHARTSESCLIPNIMTNLLFYTWQLQPN